MIGMTLVTHQTGPEGRLVSRVLIEQGLDIARELYLGLILDRARPGPSSWPAPTEAWTSKRSRPTTPERIFKEYISPGAGLRAVSGPQAGVRAGPGRARRRARPSS